MGRKRNVYLRDFFIQKEFESECKLCGKKINCSYLTNLKRHLQKYHKELLNDHEKKMKSEQYEIEQSSKTKFTTEMSKTEVVDACIALVTNESLPLSFFDSQPFKILTGPVFEGLQIQKINSKNIMELVNTKCEKIKSKIRDTLKEKWVSLKMDTATRSDRAILGINVQIISESKIVIFSLAMLELKTRHTAENLKVEIEAVLKDFNIDKKQIYSVTTDNGRNLVKAVELLSPDDSESEEEKEEIDNTENFENIVNHIHFENISSIKCAAHTLQLSVKDFLVEFNSVIERARKAVKILRTPSFRYKIKTSNIPKPQLDVVTRWGSSYNMLKRLLELKEFCINNLAPSDQINANEWVAIENIVSVLEPVHILTLKLQNNQLLLGDFYKFWLELNFQLKNMNNDISKKVLACIESRQTALLENDTIYAALFLDPRFRRLLSHEKKESAKRHLKKIVIQIQNLKNQKYDKPSTQEEQEPFLIDESSVQSTSSLLRSGLLEMEILNSSSDDDDDEGIIIDNNTSKAFLEIDNYTEKRMDVDADLVEYWNSKKYVLPWLRKLAFILHSVPATQVSVERSFSALKLILGDLRYNLSEANLEALMIVKLNNDV